MLPVSGSLGDGSRAIALSDETKRVEEYKRLCEQKLQRVRRHYAPRDLFDFVVRWKTLADDLETMPDPAAPGTPEGHGLAIPLGDQVNLQDQVKKLIALLVKDAVDKEVIRDGSELVDAAIKHVGHVRTHSGDGLNADGVSSAGDGRRTLAREGSRENERHWHDKRRPRPIAPNGDPAPTCADSVGPVVRGTTAASVQPAWQILGQHKALGT